MAALKRTSGFFDSLKSAVRWVDSMSADKPAESWICARSEKFSILQARERVERERKQNIPEWMRRCGGRRRNVKSRPSLVRETPIPEPT